MLLHRRRLPVRHSTKEEVEVVGRVMRWEKGSAADALREVNARRAPLPVKERVAPLSKSSVHRYANGQTHSLWKPEGRGAKRQISKLDILRLSQARRRLIQQAGGHHRVTYQKIIDEAKETNALECDPCQRVVEDALRGGGVCYRKPRLEKSALWGRCENEA